MSGSDRGARRHDPRVVDELRFHRDRLVEDYIAAGMTRAEAERRAFLEFGNVATIEESVRDVRGRWLDDFAKDLVYALRTLRRSPGFSFVAVLSLALGIGANAAIFSLISGVMLRALPVHEPGRLVQITRLLNGRPGQVSYPVVRDIPRQHHVHLGRLRAAVRHADGCDRRQRGDRRRRLRFGLLLHGARDRAGRRAPARAVGRCAVAASPAAVISDRYWQRRFGGSPAAIGTSVTIRDRIFTIVGVTPPSFTAPAWEVRPTSCCRSR